MTTKQYNNYLKFVAKEQNIMLVSEQNFLQYEELKDQFGSNMQRNMCESELYNLTLELMENKIDIVILDFTLDANLAKKFYKTIAGYNDRIIVIGLLSKNDIEELVDILDTLDNFLFDDFSFQELGGKIFLNLSVFYAIKDITVKHGDTEVKDDEISDDLDKFFDTYEGSSLFVVDELIELNNQLKSGDLSPEIISKVSAQMEKLVEIFSHHKDTEEVVIVIKKFQKFLNTLDISKVKPSSLYAFDYLCAIIDDTNSNIMKMFAKRVLRDVYIFEHSLSSNLSFMSHALYCDLPSEDESELEFFE